MDMKGGCSPQNATKLPEFSHNGNKFNKFFFRGRRLGFWPDNFDTILRDAVGGMS